jgi:hypothetical protein
VICLDGDVVMVVVVVVDGVGIKRPAFLHKI